MPRSNRVNPETQVDQTEEAQEASQARSATRISEATPTQEKAAPPKTTRTSRRAKATSEATPTQEKAAPPKTTRTSRRAKATSEATPTQEKAAPPKTTRTSRRAKATSEATPIQEEAALPKTTRTSRSTKTTPEATSPQTEAAPPTTTRTARSTKTTPEATSPQTEAAPPTTTRTARSTKTTPEAAPPQAEIPPPRIIPRLLERYRQEVVPALMQEFGYRNTMEVPRLTKVVLNIGLGEALQNSKAQESASRDLTLISGQHPITTRARKSIAGFKLREGMPIGLMVTLRGNRMYDFMDRLMNAALPRIRDFRGISRNAFDGRGNFSLGIREQVIFPEIDYNQIDRIRGFQVSIVTTARTDRSSLRLLELLGMPFTRVAVAPGQTA